MAGSPLLPYCLTHQRLHTSFCPACRGAAGGAIGGRARTKKKRQAAKRNARQRKGRPP